MIRLATPADAAAIEAFLATHAETSMFLRSNLEVHGTDERDHPKGTRFYLWAPSDQIEAVFGLTNGGFLMAQASNAKAAAFAGFAEQITGARVIGMTGEPRSVHNTLGALGLNGRPFQINRLEPLFSLGLADLPDPQDTIRAPVSEDFPLLCAWFAGYNRDSGLDPASHPGDADVVERARNAIGDAEMRILMIDGNPCAMASPNARVKDIVQIGGVYVPPEKRNTGIGGRVTRALLTELRTQGVSRAILFASGAAAARCYENIGFEHIGSYHIAMLSEPDTLGRET